MRRATALVAVSAARTPALTGCADLTREAMCRDGEYPAWSVDHPGSGRACEANSEAPPPGYAPYPKDRVPHWTDEDYTPTLSASAGR